MGSCLSTAKVGGGDEPANTRDDLESTATTKYRGRVIPVKGAASVTGGGGAAFRSTTKYTPSAYELDDSLMYDECSASTFNRGDFGDGNLNVSQHVGGGDSQDQNPSLLKPSHDDNVEHLGSCSSSMSAEETEPEMILSFHKIEGVDGDDTYGTSTTGAGSSSHTANKNGSRAVNPHQSQTETGGNLTTSSNPGGEHLPGQPQENTSWGADLSALTLSTSSPTTAKQPNGAERRSRSPPSPRSPASSSPSKSQSQNQQAHFSESSMNSSTRIQSKPRASSRFGHSTTSLGNRSMTSHPKSTSNTPSSHHDDYITKSGLEPPPMPPRLSPQLDPQSTPPTNPSPTTLQPVPSLGADASGPPKTTLLLPDSMASSSEEHIIATNQTQSFDTN